MKTSEQVDLISAALVQASAEMPAIAMNKTNPYYNSMYADLGAVVQATKPILAKYGLAMFQTNTNDGDKVGVTTRLIHSSGQWMEDTIVISLPAGSKNPAQDAGKSVTYFKRYMWSAFLGLNTEEDDDANGLSKKEDKKKKEPAVEDAALADLKANILKLCTDLSVTPDAKAKVVETIESVAGVKNPNTIKTVKIATELLTKLTEMKGNN